MLPPLAEEAEGAARFPALWPATAEGVPDREVEKLALAGRGFVDVAGLRDAILDSLAVWLLLLLRLASAEGDAMSMLEMRCRHVDILDLST